MPTRRRFLQQSAAGAIAAAIPTSASPQPQTPPPNATAISWKRQIPLRYTCDVAIAGGGIAGACAALAAARSGARTILIERFAVTGGNATIGGVGAFCGETAGQGEAFDDIIAGLESFGAIAPYAPYAEREARVFDPEILAFVLQERLLARQVKLLLHTQVVDVCLEQNTITECIIAGPSGPEAIRAAHFIDATGEATLLHQAGFETQKGRPSDGLQLPMSMMFFVRHIAESEARPQLPENWLPPIRRKEDLPMTSLWPNGPASNALKIKIPGFDASNTESLTAAEIQARRRAMQVLDYYQRIERKPWILDHMSSRIGIREGRRAVGDYTLTVDDLHAGRTFDDAIARGVFYLDGHDPSNDKRTYILPPEQRQVPPYQIPFRCLHPKDARNLLVAGRCFSADQLALSSARVMTTCAMMGQAAGIAAAMAAQAHASLDALDPASIRKTLQDRGARLEVG